MSPDWVAMPRKLLSLCTTALLCCVLACRSSVPPQPALSIPVFSPDGKAIVITSADAKTCFMYRVDTASGTASRITHATSGCENQLAFSPDGKLLAYMLAPAPGSHAALMVANADGSAARTLVSADEDNLEPIFLPHSNQLLFLRSAAFEHHSPLVDNRRHKFDVFSADLTTGAVTQLTHNQFYEINSMSISPDGTHLLLSQYSDAGAGFRILPLNSATEQPTDWQPPVPNGPTTNGQEYGGTWLPDGSGIIFFAATTPPSGGNSFNYNIYRAKIHSASAEPLTNLTGMMDGIALSPNGKRLAMLRSGSYSILDLDSRNISPIALKLPK
jgi:Tol biopolymer transport system component